MNWKSKSSDISGHHIRRRLARECDKASDPAAVEKERVRSMNSTNPAVVLRNYIAQNAIEAAERGDFSEVRGHWNGVIKTMTFCGVLIPPPQKTF